MGLIVSVYRNANGVDCTSNGLSYRFNKFTVVNANGPFNPDEDAPAAKLVEGPLGTVRLVPVELLDSGAWVMYGGNLATTSDSRFSEAIKRFSNNNSDVVKIFDRVE